MSYIAKSLANKRGIRRYFGPKRAIVLLAFMAAIYWIWRYYQSGALSPGIIEQYHAEHPLTSIMLFILVYAVSVFALIPALPMNLAAGYFWGAVAGGAYATIGVTIGGLMSFVTARWLVGQPLAARFDNKMVSEIQQEFERNGWKFVAFLRINPVVPTGLLNYILGLTSISIVNFVWVTMVFLLPPAIAVAYIGEVLQSFTAQSSEADHVIKKALAVSAVVLLLGSAKYFARLIKKHYFAK